MRDYHIERIIYKMEPIEKQITNPIVLVQITEPINKRLALQGLKGNLDLNAKYENKK